MNRKRKFSSNDDLPRKRQRTNGHNGYHANGRGSNNSSTRSSPSPSLSQRPYSKPNFNPNYDSEKINRPRVDSHSYDTSQNIEFQQVDTDYYIGFDPITGKRNNGRSQRAIIRMFGVTEKGESVLCHCVGFAPYFYCKTWQGFQQGQDEELLKNALNCRMLQNNTRTMYKCDEYVTKVIAVKKQSIWGYNFGKNELFLKVYLNDIFLS